MKKFLILTVSVLFVSCPVGPSIPTEALFCIAGKTKGTARIEAVGGNEATAGFGKTFVFKESFTLSFFFAVADGSGRKRRPPQESGCFRRGGTLSQSGFF